jgi:hypothetical protein
MSVKAFIFMKDITVFFHFLLNFTNKYNYVWTIYVDNDDNDDCQINRYKGTKQNKRVSYMDQVLDLDGVMLRLSSPCSGKKFCLQVLQ